MTDPAPLLPLAASIADGSPVDWDAAEANASPDERPIIRQLRVLANLATLHRSLPADPGTLPHALAARRESPAPAIGSWAHLDLIERLGGGTFADVYRAWDRHLEREVALKLLRVDEAIDDPQTSRIAVEARLLARVKHPNVITVYGVAVHDGRVGLWMELVRGATFEQVLHAQGAFSAREASLVGIDLSRALAAIHKAGLIHRDVKAQNVMREDGGRLVLMDLGTSREIDRRYAFPDLAGTPLYLAPEIFGGAVASERTDLYSVGVLLYHLVTNSFPVRATTIDGLNAGHEQGSAVRLRDARPDLPSAFVHVVDRAIARDPDSRFASAGELEADLVRGLDEKPAPQPAPVPADAKPRRRFVSWPALAAAATIAALLVFAVARWQAGRTPASSAPGTVGPIRSIAVLPLVNLSGDPAQEYFAVAMTDELIGTLGQMAGVNVISGTSTLPFKGSDKSLPEIARDVHADAVLEGSVLMVPPDARDRSAPARVRINARLIYAGTDTQLWDRTFEKVVGDVLALQSEVARAVSEGIGAHLVTRAGGSAKAGPEVAQTPRQVNPQSYDAYLRGRYLASKRTPEDLRKAIDQFKAAVDADPTYPLAWAGLADGYMLFASYDEQPPREADPRAKAAAMRALELDESLAEAHAVLAWVYWTYEWDLGAAERAFQRALALNPNYAVAHARYGLYLNEVRRFDEGLAELKRAQELDPLSLVTEVNVGRAHYFARHFDKAIESLRRLEQREPNYWVVHAFLGQTYLATGDLDEAIRQLERARKLSPSSIRNTGVLGDAYARRGRRRDASNLLDEMTRSSRQRYVPPAYPAMIYMGLGEKNRALDLLDQAYADRSDWVLLLAVDPQFDPLRAEPRFRELLQRVGIDRNAP